MRSLLSIQMHTYMQKHSKFHAAQNNKPFSIQLFYAISQYFCSVICLFSDAFHMFLALCIYSQIYPCTFACSQNYRLVHFLTIKIFFETIIILGINKKSLGMGVQISEDYFILMIKLKIFNLVNFIILKNCKII